MEWWQTMLVAVAPAVVTVLGLQFQLHQTTRREQVRRRDDTQLSEAIAQRQVEDRQQDRRDAVDAHWRDERLARFTRVFDVLTKMTRQASGISAIAREVATAADDEALRSAWARLLEEYVTFTLQRTGDLTEAVTAASLVASDTFSLTLIGMLDDLKQEAKVLIALIERGPRSTDEQETHEAWTNFAWSVSLLHTRMINLARWDLADGPYFPHGRLRPDHSGLERSETQDEPDTHEQEISIRP